MQLQARKKVKKYFKKNELKFLKIIFFRPRTTLKKTSEIIEMYIKSIKDDRRRLAFFMPDIIQRQLYDVFKIRGIILKQRFFVTNVGLSLTSNHFMYPLANDVMRNLISGGIAQYLEKYHTDLVYPYYYEEEAKEPIVLNIEDLSFGFVIWLVTSGISFVIFIYEILSVRYSKGLNSCQACLGHFVGLISFLKILIYIMKLKIF